MYGRVPSEGSYLIKIGPPIGRFMQRKNCMAMHNFCDGQNKIVAFDALETRSYGVRPPLADKVHLWRMWRVVT